MLSRIARTLWGDISRQELKKFGLLSLIFFFIIGSYWMLKVMKNSLFMHLVGPQGLPYAKMVSIVSLIVLLLFYNKLIDIFEKTKLLYIISIFYGFLYLIISVLLTHPTIGIENTAAGNDRILGWVIYVAIESFGSIVVALFWSFVATIMDPTSGKRGYPIIVAGAQLGSIFTTFFLMTQTSRFGVPLLMAMAACCVLLVPLMVKIFHTHHYEAVSNAEQKYEKKIDSKDSKKSTGMIEGLRLIGSHTYLLGILVVSTAYEMIGVLFELQMEYSAKAALNSLEKVTEFLGFYGLMMNGISFLFALIGTSFFMRRFGLTACLVLYPIFIACMVSFSWVFPGLWMFFTASILIKGFGYALNNPCKEIMYIPTSNDIKFKAKSWIDVQGNRSAKSVGAAIAAIFPIASQLLLYGSIISLGIIGFWVPIALFVGRKHQNLVQNNQIVS